jgi:hypothetical protein
MEPPAWRTDTELSSNLDLSEDSKSMFLVTLTQVSPNRSSTLTAGCGIQMVTLSPAPTDQMGNQDPERVRFKVTQQTSFQGSYTCPRC